MEKSIAITGATGLLGAQLANQFLEKEFEVFALVKDENARSLLSKDVTRVYGDIGNKSDMEYFIQRSNPLRFAHLAAQTQAYDSLRYPYQTFYNNFVGTLNVLDALREYGQCSSIIVASSDKAYGEMIGDSYVETHPLNGIYPYDASKSATDIVAQSYRLTYDLPIATTRACNIYGIGDFNKQRLIPAIVNAHIKHIPFVMRNGGADVREYINVLDVVKAYERIFEHIESSNTYGSFNISSGDRYSTIEIFEFVQNIIGKDIPSQIVTETTLEIRKQYMSSERLSANTEWRSSIPFAEGLPVAVNWYLENLK